MDGRTGSRVLKTMPCYHGLVMDDYKNHRQLHHRREEQFQKRGPDGLAFRGL